MTDTLTTIIALVSLLFGCGLIVRTHILAKDWGKFEERVNKLEVEQSLSPSIDAMKLAIKDAITEGNKELYDNLNAHYVRKDTCDAKHK